MKAYSFLGHLVSWFSLLLVVACGRSSAATGNSAVERDARIAQDMKGLIAAELVRWRESSQKVQALAPSAGRGWSATEDAGALRDMRLAWGSGREAYELIEGAIAATFPESDAATDARYDDFLARLGAQGDANAFDGAGVVGMHAIERVLWAQEIQEDVVRFERGLSGYRAARYPESAVEAQAFKEQLAGRLVADIVELERAFTPLELDVAFAFQGLIDLAAEQVEKVDRAATGQEESRYAQTTMRDLRANYRGCLSAYRVFEPWVKKTSGGAALDKRVLAAFSRLEAAYAAVKGDSIPRPPSGWSSISPQPEHAESAFGQLYMVVKRESDPARAGSLTAELYAVARALELQGVVMK